MSRFNKPKVKPKVSSPLGVQPDTESVTNLAGGKGFVRGSKSDLYELAVSFMGGDDNFYESSDTRYTRLISLANEVAVSDGRWFRDFVGWVRTGAQMRTVAIVLAVEGVRARNAHARRQQDSERALTSQPAGLNSSIISAACARADEPGEMLAYYMSNYGKKLPRAIMIGLEHAARRLYNQYSVLKYDSSKSSVRFADVINLCHVNPVCDVQSKLFCYLTTSKKHPAKSALENELSRLSVRRSLMNIPVDQRRELISADKIDKPKFVLPSNSNGDGRTLTVREALKYGGMTWEVISEWLPGGMDAEAWEVSIPNMGVFALLRNLRNFDEAGISTNAYDAVVRTLTSPLAVEKSRILPMRVLSAYRAVSNVRWHYPLEMCLNLTLDNIPKLTGNATTGRTLVLVDMSASMSEGTIGDRSKLTYADAASIFGAVLSVRNQEWVDLYQFGDRYQNHYSRYYGGRIWEGCTEKVENPRGASILYLINKFAGMGGTDTLRAIAETFRAGVHQRVIIITDEQGRGYNDVGSVLPDNIPLYTWNLAGYPTSHSKRPNSYLFGGGFSDASFGMINALESGKDGRWPW